MSTSLSSAADEKFLNNAMSSFIQIGAVLLLVFWCYSIVTPFISVVVWGLIIAVALFPIHLKLTELLGGRAKSSSTLLVLIGLAILLVPTWTLTESTVVALKSFAENVHDGAIAVELPDASVAEWPVIGERLFKIWTGAATNLEATLNEFQPQLLSFGQWTLAFAGSMAMGVLQFIFSLIIAGVLMLNADAGYKVAHGIATSLSSTRGAALTDMAIQTIRSVSKGVLGVAIIQTLLAAVGLVAMDIPAAGIWVGVVLVLAIIQLPPIIILGPIAVWVFSVAEPVPATIFAVYMFVVSMADAFLKPLLLGRGVDVPMLVILIGAIGGAITSGIVGLFIGAVILALGYQLLISWMALEGEPEEDATDGHAASSETA
jgi:predicted PurR-regulated permease PerM